MVVKIVIVDWKVETASQTLITDNTPRRLNFHSDLDRSKILAKKLFLKLYNKLDSQLICRLNNYASARSRVPLRFASTVSISKPGLAGLLYSLDKGNISAEAWLDFISTNYLPENIRMPAVNTISACATGITSIIRGAMMLQNNECDIAFSGAAEASLHNFIISGFKQMRVLSKSRPRPFDSRRDGFVPAEGGAVFALTREEDAGHFSIKPKAAILGWALASSITDPVASNGSGEAIAELIESALENARLKHSDIGYLHVHGTGTKQNDIAESNALKKIFETKGLIVPASSTKALTGHCLGAAGAVETALTIEHLKYFTAPPNYGLEEIDALCNYKGLITEKMKLNKQTGIILSYGFGGQMAALIIKAFND